MVKVRLMRTGAKKRPFYRVVVADGRNARNGRCVEHIGTYDPKSDPASITFKQDRLDYWLGCGARPTLVVSQIIQRYREEEAERARAEPAAAAPAAAPAGQ